MQCSLYETGTEHHPGLHVQECLGFGERLAGLYYVGTKKEYRGRGVGSAVTLAAMKEGRERGYEVGILGASQLGFGVYQHAGFKEYYKLHLFSG